MIQDWEHLLQINLFWRCMFIFAFKRKTLSQLTQRVCDKACHTLSVYNLSIIHWKIIDLKKNTMFLLKTQMQCLTVLHFFNCVDAVVTSVTHFPINIMFVHTYTSPLKVVVILNIVTIKYILIITQKHFSNQKMLFVKQRCNKNADIMLFVYQMW